jgi:hypothetical protein
MALGGGLEFIVEPGAGSRRYFSLRARVLNGQQPKLLWVMRWLEPKRANRRPLQRLESIHDWPLSQWLVDKI